MSMNSLVCWHNGELKKLGNVHVSVTDFGFIHSEATYDVLKAINGNLKFYELHRERFFKSCEYYGFEPISEIDKIARQLIQINSLLNVFVWTCVWRGTPPTGSPRDMNGPQNSLVYVKPYYGLSHNSYLRLSLHTENRRVSDRSYLQTAKNFSWIELTFAQKKAISRGFDSAIVLSPSDFISEGPGFGICFVKDGVVFTPLKDCLFSITISIVEKICSENSIPFFRRDITAQEALEANEAFACSTSGGITLVSQIESKSFTHNLSLKIKECYDGNKN